MIKRAIYIIVIIFTFQCNNKPPTSNDCSEEMAEIIKWVDGSWDHVPLDSIQSRLYTYYSVANTCDSKTKETYFRKLIQLYRGKALVDSCSKYLDICKEKGFYHKENEISLVYEEMWNNFYKGHVDTALDLGEKAKLLSIERDDTTWTIKIISSILQFKSYSSPTSKDILEESDNLRELSIKAKDTVGIIMALRQIGHFNYQQGVQTGSYDFFLEAVTYAKDAARFAKSSNELTLLAYVYNDLAVFYSPLGFDDDSPDRALADSVIAYGKKSLELKQKNGDLRGAIICKFNLADYYKDLVRLYQEDSSYLEIGKEHLNSALQLSDSMEEVWLNMQAKFNLGRFYMYEMKNDSAINIFKETADYGIKNKIDFAVESYYNLAELYSINNDFKSAYEANVQFSNLKDSLVRESNNSQILELNEKYQNEKLKNENIIHKSKNKKRLNLIIGLSLTFFITIIFLVKAYLESSKAINLNKRYQTLIDEIKSHINLIVPNVSKNSESLGYFKNVQSMIGELESDLQNLFRFKVPLLTTSKRKRQMFYALNEKYDSKLNEININLNTAIKLGLINTPVDIVKIQKMINELTENELVKRKVGNRFYKRVSLLLIVAVVLNFVFAILAFFSKSDILFAPGSIFELVIPQLSLLISIIVLYIGFKKQSLDLTV